MADNHEVKMRRRALTPTLAQKWLNTVTNNRTVKAHKVTQYADDIVSGAWQENAETIKFDIHDRMIDGQHRCHAVIQADKPIYVWVATGVQRTAFKTIDSGKSRSKEDVLKIAGEVNTAVLAGTLNKVWQNERGFLWIGGGMAGTKRAWATNAEILNTLKKHPKVRDSVEYATKFQTKRFVSVTIVAFTHYIFTGLKPRKAKEFFEKLLTGHGMDKGDPVLALRERLFKIFAMRTQAHVQIKASHVLSLVIKAWNAHLEGRKMTRLTFAPMREKHPAING